MYKRFYLTVGTILILCQTLNAKESALADNYKVQPKDTLWAISHKHLGAGHHWHKIKKINPQIVNPDLIYPKQHLLIPSSATLAQQPIQDSYHNGWYIDFGVGSSWFGGSADYDPSDPSFVDIDKYRFSTPSKSTELTVGGGYQWNRKTIFWLPAYRLGLTYIHYSPQKSNGSFSLENSRTYPFGYSTQEQALFVTGSIDLFTWHKITPFLKAGVGLSLNKFSSFHFNDTSLMPEEQFGNAQRAQASYLLGAGANYQFNKHWGVGLEYQYTNLGTIDSQKNGRGLSLPIKFQANSLLLSMRYNFNQLL